MRPDARGHGTDEQQSRRDHGDAERGVARARMCWQPPAPVEDAVLLWALRARHDYCLRHIRLHLRRRRRAAYLRSLLPAPHFAKESQDIVRLGMGLVATMTALLLGIVTASARSTFDEQDRDVRDSAVNILTLDRHLARYGAETRQTRELIKRAVEFRIANTWPTQGAGGYGEALSMEAVESIEDQILNLSPQTDAQRWFKNESLRLAMDVLKTRWRILQSSARIPGAFLAVVIFWLTVTFASFGLYAPKNATVISVLVIAALSVAAAMFLIVELDGPFDGVIRVSGDSLRFALSHLGKQ